MQRPVLVFTVMCAIIALSGLPASAQSVKVKASVPFDFLIGDRSYSAGDYLFSAQKDNVIVQRAGHSWGVMMLANRITGNSAGSTGRVIFRCYEQQCFLSQLWVPGTDEGRALLSSPREVREARRTPGVYMALLGEP